MEAVSEGRYQSLGGDGYISPGRRSYQPSTDLIDRPTSLRQRSQRALFLLLSLLVLVASAVAAFLFFPRPVSSTRSAVPPSIDCFSVDPAQRNVTTWQYTHTVTVTNPNYAPLTVQSALVFFTLVPSTNSSHHRAAAGRLPPPPLPSPCPAHALPLGSSVVSPASSTVSAVSSTDVSLSDRFAHTGDDRDELRLCLQRTCAESDAYELDVDGLLRVRWLQVEADVVMETVRVRVQCADSDEGDAEDAEADDHAAADGLR